MTTTVDCPQNLEELFEVFDENNRSTDTTIARGVVHKQGLFHRSVQVLVFNSKGEVLIQQRNPKKDTAANCWDLSCSEHLQPKEEYHDAAIRGMLEELGIPQEAVPVARIVPAFLQENVYPNVNVIDREFVECWTATYDGQITLDGVEVVDSKWMPYEQFLASVKSQSKSENEFQWAPWVADTTNKINDLKWLP